MSPAHVRACACLLLLCATLQAIMQDEQTLKLRAEARLVEVVVTVRDAQGKAMKGLQKSDFTLLDNNKPRAFSIFSANDFDSAATPATPAEATKAAPPALPPNTFTNTRITAPPQDTHSTIILLDGLNGWFDSFGWGVKGVEGLTGKLPADEQVALYVIEKFNGLELVQDYTTDRAKLLHAVSTYNARGMHPAPPGTDPPDGHGLVDPYNQPVARKTMGLATGGIYGIRKTIANQADYELHMDSESVRLSLQALAEKLRVLPGRKSVYWITEGFPPRLIRDTPGWAKTISALNDANVEVNTVDTDGFDGPGRYWGPGGIISMQMVAEQTGGRAFFHTNDLAGSMAEGIADDRSSYTLAFYLTDVDSKYHELKLKLDRPNVQLSYRQGYFARSEADADLDARKSDLTAILTNPVDAIGVGITATIDMKPATPRGTLAAHVKLDPEALTVTRVNNQWNCKVEEVFLELNAEGAELAKFSMEQPFSITDAQKPGFDAHGASLTQTIPLIPGAAKLQIAVRDTASGRTGSISIPLNQGTETR